MQRVAKKYMTSTESGRSSAVLGPTRGSRQGDDTSAKVVVVGLTKIDARRGTRRALGVNSSVLQPRW